MNIEVSKIIENLTRDYVFYFPHDLTPMLKGTLFENILPKDAFNTLAYIDSEGNISTNLKTFFIVKMLAKKNILDENIITLFEYQKTLDEKQFDFLINKYMPFVNSHLFITKWMLNNLKKTFENLRFEIINLFEIQNDHFQKHYKELTSQFKIERSSDDDFNNLKDAFEFKTNELNQSTKKLKKDEKVIISDEEIDRFLLTSIFNVKL